MIIIHNYNMMIVGTSTVAKNILKADLKKTVFRILIFLVYHKNLVTINFVSIFINLQSILHLQFLHIFYMLYSLLVFFLNIFVCVSASGRLLDGEEGGHGTENTGVIADFVWPCCRYCCFYCCCCCCSFVVGGGVGAVIVFVVNFLTYIYIVCFYRLHTGHGGGH